MQDDEELDLRNRFQHVGIASVAARQGQCCDQVAVLYEKADITPRQKVMLDAAMVLATDPGTFGKADIEQLKAAGFDEDDIWDIGAITAFFALSNRMAHLPYIRR